MNSYIYSGRLTPAFVVFMIDQSASMINFSLGDGNKAEIAAWNVQNAILEIVRGNILGEIIRDNAFITVIGYGQKYTPATIIRQGWVSEWADDVLRSKYDGTCIIPAIADFSPCMEEGFSLAKDLCEEWIKVRKKVFEFNEICGLGPIVIINITKGTVCNENLAYRNAKELTSLQNTRLYNIMIPNIDNYEEVIFPCYNPLLDREEMKWLFEVTSKLPEGATSLAQVIGENNIFEESRGFAISISLDCASVLCRYSHLGIETHDNQSISQNI